MERFDCVVVGGGMVGAAAALGLAQQGKRVAVIEGQQPTAFDATQPMDLRVSAISPHSVKLLDALESWEGLKAMRLCPFRRLETWEHPLCRTRFSTEGLNRDWLGYIVENRLIQLSLWAQFRHFPRLRLYCPDRLVSLEERGNEVLLTLESGEQIFSELVVAADGANSKVRQLAGIGITSFDYRQHCMLINVETEAAQQDITWQQFTPQGPRSFLPLPGHQASLVWYDSPQRIRQLGMMSNKQLEQAIDEHFPEELGEVKVIRHGAFPLTRRHAQQYFSGRVVLMGDAAHTINPLAGQGVNLGFKDVSAFLGLAAEVDDFSSPLPLLQQYECRRRADNSLMQSTMDLFYGVFSNDLPPLKLLRNAGLALAEKAGPVKAQALKYAMGL
ncbi:2-octaprenyl-3-methyl-6-methoxy-1,4-benzoquinol hydroxylase [Thaumasiovibrio subtropicus]|uniref:2-octaprenyl-3-methyl-6-methoxy-1,4-benzoquinol hydroxylase n=1 Tax=Thaumasiovibrio subtropicus TaxID=1891207 RepID=UPI000B360992|nr:2-octaprenyl-3-methyl-6-methoxy-1,4-benzoquinol hydroxylase [Thaumasiovibrio subtropicus]